MRHTLAFITCLAVAVVSLASCRAVPQAGNALVPSQPSPDVQVSDERVETRTSRAIDSTPEVALECVPDAGLPIPANVIVPWAPPGIAGPWPHDEYLKDGGDREVQVNLLGREEVHGIDLEDTVVLYDTTDGRTLIEPSNRVCLYAPRFAAVRKVTSIIQNEQRDQPIGIRLPLKPVQQQEDLLATTAVQPIQPEGEIGRKQPSIERVGEGPMPAISRLPVMAIDGGLATYENLKAIRQGIFEESEKARLIELVDAAITWSHDKAVQVVLDGRQAVEVAGEQKAQVTYRIDEPDNACLRVIKIASTKVARPGDVVDFTIRFDNLGDTTINNVVLIDNLTTRLEYVPYTAQSSREAEFSTERNEGESLMLRWEFTEPLKVGEGGLVRFHCRVR